MPRRAVPGPLARWLACVSAELAEGAVAVAAPPRDATLPPEWTFSSEESSWASSAWASSLLAAGISNLAPQWGQIPRLPARAALMLSLCPLGQKTRIPMIPSAEGDERPAGGVRVG